MADINATSLTTKTTPDGTDNLVLFNQNTNVGYQIDYDNLASAILDKLTSKTYTNQVGGSSAATLLSQLATLNSNKVPFSNGTNLSSNDDLDSLSVGFYYTEGHASPANMPTGSNLLNNIILVISQGSSSARKAQFFISWNAGEIYWRTWMGSWRSWVKII